MRYVLWGSTDASEQKTERHKFGVNTPLTNWPSKVKYIVPFVPVAFALGGI